VTAAAEEIAAELPGVDLVPDAQVTMDRAFDLPAPPAVVWPWLAQLGKNRAGWYFPRCVERTVPAGDRPAPRRRDRTRVHLRFRIAGVRRVWLLRTGGELADLLTVAGLAAGLRERVTHPAAES
jgi:hypothetical protein